MYSAKIFYWSALSVLLSTFTRALDNEILSPINIVTSEVKYSRVEIPFKAEVNIISTLFPLIAVNTGTAITFNKLLRTSEVLITGPLLGNEKYLLSYQQLYLNQSLGRSGHAINGKGYPIEGVNIFFNEKYKNLNNATKYDDGIVVLSQPVQVKGLLDNPEFFEFENILRSGALRKPQSVAIISPLGSFAWYDSFLIGHAFFKYKGSYYDPVKEKQICPATILTTQPIFYNSISLSQFKAFENVLGKNSKPLNTVSPIYSKGSRKVEGTRGVIAKLLPLGIHIPVGISIPLP